jgi:hypothetical protein
VALSVSTVAVDQGVNKMGKVIDISSNKAFNPIKAIQGFSHGQKAAVAGIGIGLAGLVGLDMFNTHRRRANLYKAIQMSRTSNPDNISF